MDPDKSKRRRTPPADSQGVQQDPQNIDEPSKRQKIRAIATVVSEHTDGQDASAGSSTAQNPEQPASSGDKVFDAELEAVEISLGYTGKYHNYSDDKEKNAGDKLSCHVYKMTQRWAAEVSKPETTWTTKKNIISAILHIMMAVLEAPLGWCARTMRQDSHDLGLALMRALEAMTIEERAILGTDKEFILGMVEVTAESKAYCIDGSMEMAEAKKMLQEAVSSVAAEAGGSDDGSGTLWPVESSENMTAVEWKRKYDPTHIPPHPQPLGRAPWYPLVLNKIIVPEIARPDIEIEGDPDEELGVEDSSDMIEHLADDLRYSDEYETLECKEALAMRVDEVTSTIQEILDYNMEWVTSPGAAWETIVNAASSLLSMCALLTPRRPGFSDISLLWCEVEEKLLEAPICPDQYLMRVVQYLTTSQRLRLSGEPCTVGEGTILEALERVMRRTRRKRSMRALETVRDMLMLAKEEIANEEVGGVSIC